MVADGVVYAHSLSGYLHTLDARTGESFWSLDVGYHWWRRPFAVSEGVVYVGYLPTTWTEGEERRVTGYQASPYEATACGGIGITGTDME